MNIIAAIGKNRELGKNNTLLWNLRDDMKYFRDITMGHTVVMGRRTYESIGKPLQGRKNIVVSTTLVDPHVQVVAELSQTLALPEVFVIGGAQLFREALPHATLLYLTLIDATATADVYFPPFEHLFECVSRKEGTGKPRHEFTIWKRQG